MVSTPARRQQVTYAKARGLSERRACALMSVARLTLHYFDVARSVRSARVIEFLSRLISLYGAPRYLRSDYGPEFVSRAILKWAAQNGMDMALSSRQALAERRG